MARTLHGVPTPRCMVATSGCMGDATPRCVALTSVDQAAISDCSGARAPNRHPETHCRVSELNSFSGNVQPTPVFWCVAAGRGAGGEGFCLSLKLLHRSLHNHLPNPISIMQHFVAADASGEEQG